MRLKVCKLVRSEKFHESRAPLTTFPLVRLPANERGWWLKWQWTVGWCCWRRGRWFTLSAWLARLLTLTPSHTLFHWTCCLIFTFLVGRINVVARVRRKNTFLAAQQEITRIPTTVWFKVCKITEHKKLLMARQYSKLGCLAFLIKHSTFSKSHTHTHTYSVYLYTIPAADAPKSALRQKCNVPLEKRGIALSMLCKISWIFRDFTLFPSHPAKLKLSNFSLVLSCLWVPTF